MDKKKVISVVTKAAKIYHDKLEDQKVMFVFGVPTEVRKQIESNQSVINSLEFYEVAFHGANFLHLTGLKMNKAEVETSKHFYSKCLDGRLSAKDFFMAKDGSTVQKLDVLENMMNIKTTASMIGDFTDAGVKLYSEKVAGNVFVCMGFVEDGYTKLNVPNTLLKKDIRTMASKPQKKIYAVLSKRYDEEKYTQIDKCDKALELKKVLFLQDLLEDNQ